MAGTTAACQQYNRAVLSAVKAALATALLPLLPWTQFCLFNETTKCDTKVQPSEFRVWPKIRDKSNEKCRSWIWMVECEGKDDGWPKNGSAHDCQVRERVKRKQPRHKMGRRMDLCAKWDENELEDRRRESWAVLGFY